mmetsp:Transcript_2362/g.3793  ORF Transcript_2362/g.3793 Transcript_2362/m.3793 type:complete len:124 (-) Transcript_2362:27-398(-)
MKTYIQISLLSQNLNKSSIKIVTDCFCFLEHELYASKYETIKNDDGFSFEYIVKDVLNPILFLFTLFNLVLKIDKYNYIFEFESIKKSENELSQISKFYNRKPLEEYFPLSNREKEYLNKFRK